MQWRSVKVCRRAAQQTLHSMSVFQLCAKENIAGAAGGRGGACLEEDRVAAQQHRARQVAQVALHSGGLHKRAAAAICSTQSTQDGISDLRVVKGIEASPQEPYCSKHY